MKLPDLVAFLCLIIALVILWQFRQIILLIFTAIVFAIALNSLVRRLRKFGIARGKAVLLTLAGVLLFSTLFASLVLPPFLEQFQQLLKSVPEGIRIFLELLDNSLNSLPIWLPQSLRDLKPPSFADITRQVAPVSQNLLGNFFTFFSSSVTVLLQLLLVLVFTLMLLANPSAYRNLLVRIFPSNYRRRVDKILGRCETDLLSWMAGFAINSLFVATLSGLGMLMLGIPLVLANALLAGIFNFIPNIGPVASVIFPVSVTLIQAPWKAIAVVLIYLVVQNLESYWFSPMMMKRQISLLPAATLVAQLFFASFLGFLGLVLALPLAVVTKTWIEEAVIKDILDKQDKDLSNKITQEIASLEPKDSSIIAPPEPIIPEE